MLSPLKAFQIFYCAAFLILSIYSIIRLITSICRYNFYPAPYKIIFYIFTILFSLFQSVVYLAIILTQPKNGRQSFKVGTSFFSNCSVIFFFISLQEWDSHCHNQPFSICGVGVFLAIVFSVFSVNTLAEICSVIIQNPSVPNLDFYIMNIATLIQLVLTIIYGPYHIQTIIHNTQQDNEQWVLSCQSRTVTILLFFSLLLTLSLFGLFVSSFFQNLENNQKKYQIYCALSLGVPFFIDTLTSILLHELMNSIHRTLDNLSTTTNLV